MKPQFELDRAAIGPNGIVRDPADLERGLRTVADWLPSQGWTVLATTDSPILGGAGAREFLLHARRRA